MPPCRKLCVGAAALAFSAKFDYHGENKAVGSVVAMVRKFICALLAVLLTFPLASFIVAEDIPEVVEMPAVVTPMQTA